MVGETSQTDVLVNFPTKEPTGKPEAGWNLGSQLKTLGLDTSFWKGLFSLTNSPEF